MVTSAEFWDKLAERYAKTPIPDPDAYAYTLERTRSYLNAQDRVLELGCGTGTTALALADATGRYTASDVSANMVGIGKGKAEAAGVDNIDFVAADAGDPALGDGYDAVLAFNLLHLVEDLPQTASRVSDMLRPGGLFISKTFCLPTRGLGPAKLWAMRLALPLMQLFGKAPFVSFMKIEDLEKAITDAGFEIIETGNYPASPPRRFIVARKP